VAKPVRSSPPKRRIHAAHRSRSAGDPRVHQALAQLERAAGDRPAVLTLVQA
jgi:hypothetical protein